MTEKEVAEAGGKGQRAQERDVGARDRRDQCRMRGGKATPTLDVPNVVGLNYGQANAVLTAQGFKVERIDDPTQVNTPPEQILGQNPEIADRPVRAPYSQGSTMLLLTSSSTAMKARVDSTMVQPGSTAKASMSGNTAEIIGPR